MARRNADIVILGAGIAGLWLLARLKSAGYDALLLDTHSIGGGQSIAAQGIIHSGLKYALAGKFSELARQASAMPERWREALAGRGPVDLSAVKMAADSQILLVPPGLMGGLAGLVARKTLGGAFEIPENNWPEGLKTSGFKGAAIHMSEPVLDIPGAVRTLAQRYKNSVKKIDFFDQARALFDAKVWAFAAAAGNAEIATVLDHRQNFEIQTRPLLMAMMKNAPFPLFAHLVGASEKPVATITTHFTSSGKTVWYLGGGVAERPKDSDPAVLFQEACQALLKYMPDLNLKGVEWAALPIDRVEGRSDTPGWLPDRPTVISAGNCLYCWPNKLTFAPLLGDIVMDVLKKQQIVPSSHTSEWSGLENLSFSAAPWDKAQWIR